MSLRDKAEAGDADAQCQLGLSYSDGVNGVPKSNSEAVRWLTKAAEQNNALAEFNLGVFYAQGWGLRKNWVEACKWYLKAAEQNNSDAEINLGNCYLNGQGVRKSSAEAYKWYLKAAEQNNSDAEINLGNYYLNGQGVRKSSAEAYKWYLKAAEQNNGLGQCALGYCYMNGVGVPRDDVQAYKWSALGAAKGSPNGQNNLAVLESRMPRSAIAQAQALVREFAPGEGAPLESGTPSVPATIPADQTEVANKIIALTEQLKNPKSDIPHIIHELAQNYDVLDNHGNLKDPKSRVGLLPQRWQLLLLLEKRHYWAALDTFIVRFHIIAGQNLKTRPAWECEPWIELGRDENKVEMGLSVMGKAFPRDPEVNLWKAALRVKQRRWPEALVEASAALAKAKPGSNVALPAVTAKAYFYKFSALLFLGKLPEAKIALDHALALESNNAEFQHEQKVLAFAEQTKLVMSSGYEEQVPLGIYHLFNSDRKGFSLAGCLWTGRFVNITPSARTITLSLEIPGVTDTLTRTVVLLPGQVEDVFLTPPLKSDFDPSGLRAERPGELVLKLSDSGTNSTFLTQLYPVKLLPIDSLPFTLKWSSGHAESRYQLVGAWVTPNSPAIEQFLTAAKARAPGRTFDGPQSASLPQVKAMFDELKSTGVSYVMDPTVFSEFDFVQRTRFPSEVLASHNAQCLESSLLFASLLESIGLDVAIVRVPGHAFISWEPTKRDYATPGSHYFLETTLISSSSFGTAMDAAQAEMKSNIASGAFKDGRAFALRINNLRKQGVSPQPYR